jgi:NAD(P)-dependent dehydrogenase (short-subunit alcohol dehydrogenase family)
MINPMDMSGKTILVTGASSGIGSETCRCLSELGGRIVLVSRNREKLIQTLSSLEGAGHHFEQFDLDRVDEIPEWMSGLSKTIGPLDCLVHSAGISLTQPIRIWKSSDTEKLFKINVYAGLALAKGFRQKSIHGQNASIVFISSAVGIIGQPGLSVYSASKAAVIGATRCLALELAQDGIRVNCVAPGVVKSEMLESSRNVVLTEIQINALAGQHPLGFGKPRDVANSIAFLLSDSSRWITGTTLTVDGGYTV